MDDSGVMTMAMLKALPQWVGYTAAKVPMNPHTGGAAASNNPDTWGTAAQAWSAKKRYGWAGIGYVFTIAAGVVGVDLDDCFDAAGRLSDEARQIVQMLNSYTERSPSGSGLHILARGEIPHSVKKPGFEMYNELRYFTVTGNQYGATAVEMGFASGDIEPRQKELAALFAVYDESDTRPVASIPIIERKDSKSSPAEVAAALACIPPRGDYNTDWLPMLMAVHSEFPDEQGVALIESWSPGYRGEVAAKWRSFNAMEPGGIGIGTLFHKAMQYGYKPPSPANGRPMTGQQSRMSHADRLAALARA